MWRDEMLGAFADGIKLLADGFAELLWPTRCAVCDEPGSVLCERCADGLPYIDWELSCPHCGAPYGALVCTECDPASANGGMPFEQARCLCEYRDGAKRVIRVYKDEGERRLAPVMASLLARALDDEWAAWADAVAYIPASDAARRRRGFDHMERVASCLAAETGLAALAALTHLGAADQRRLGREGRAANMAAAFAADSEQACGNNIVLIDDVLTTGATLTAATDALLAAKAESVRVLAFARVW
jgi:ComF family protein